MITTNTPVTKPANTASSSPGDETAPPPYFDFKNIFPEDDWQDFEKVDLGGLLKGSDMLGEMVSEKVNINFVSLSAKFEI